MIIFAGNYVIAFRIVYGQENSIHWLIYKSDLLKYR